VLKAEDNEILTRVGPGTLMGNLLRRYWTPACLTAEIPEPGSPPARVRLLGENLVAFRDFGTEGLEREQWSATKLFTDCNWVQAMEGNIDTAHISHLHQWNGIDDIPDDGSDKPGYPSNAMSWKFWRHDRAPRLEVEDTWYGYKYAGIRTTPNGNTHARVTAYVVPYTTLVASIPWNQRQGLFVPMDDERTARYSFAASVPPNVHGYGGANLFAVAPFTNAARQGRTGILPRDYRPDNDYQIDREVQRTATFSGVADFVSQDLMVTESMGPIYDRSQEQLGSTDRAVTRMRHILLSAARGLAEGKEPPAVGEHDYRAVFGAEKILAPGEDWRTLATPEDPVFCAALGRAQAQPAG
jgi:phthalate 4,5-dioxygenase